MLHGFPVGGGAHDDADQWMDFNVFTYLHFVLLPQFRSKLAFLPAVSEDSDPAQESDQDDKRRKHSTAPITLVVRSAMQQGQRAHADEHKSENRKEPSMNGFPFP